MGGPSLLHDRFPPNCYFSSQEKRWGQNKPLSEIRETPLRNLKGDVDKITPLLEIREIGCPFMTGEPLVGIFVTSPLPPIKPPGKPVNLHVKCLRSSERARRSARSTTVLAFMLILLSTSSLCCCTKLTLPFTEQDLPASRGRL